MYVNIFKTAMDVIITYAYMNIFKTPMDQDSNCLHECQDNICMPLIMHVNIFKTAMDVWIDIQF